MTRTDIVERLNAVVAEHGAWGSHNVALPYGLFTIGPDAQGDNWRAAKFLQLAADLLTKPLSELRVLDLGCGEGLYAIEFAQHGAEVIGVEGRAQHIAKCRFAKAALALHRLTFEQGDVRAVSLKTHGEFDLILCSGILYHLDNPAAFDLLKALKPMCRGALFIDTRIALRPEVAVDYDGRTYHGSRYREHAAGASEEERLADGGASLDNDESFWFTRTALANLLMDLGFTTVTECWGPRPYRLREDRVTLVATAGRRLRAYNEIAHNLAAERWPATGVRENAS